MSFFNPFSPSPKSQPQKQEPTDCYIPRADWNRGTYRELKAILNELPEHYLDQTATILLSDSDEYTKMGSIGWTGPACDVLGSDHMFFTVDA